MYDKVSHISSVSFQKDDDGLKRTTDVHDHADDVVDDDVLDDDVLDEEVLDDKVTAVKKAPARASFPKILALQFRFPASLGIDMIVVLVILSYLHQCHDNDEEMRIKMMMMVCSGKNIALI